MLPRRGFGKIITVNETIINGTDPPAKWWETWGQTDVFPFSDTTTTMGDLP